MNAVVAIIPIILIRFGLLSILDKEAIKRAAFFAPLIGKEKVAYWFYQISSILIFVYPCLLKIKTTNPYWLYAGLVIYALGIILSFISVLNFAKPAKNGINIKGLYQVSRNPMYVAYFIYFTGCVLLTQSLILLAILLVFQLSAHWIILSEERWCVNKFGEEYINYMNKVRRYI